MHLQETVMPALVKNIGAAMTAGLFVCSALLAAPRASADEAPRSYIASPDVYKVIAEDSRTRVILATWRPGQRDNWHSHPPTGVYWLTGCEPRIHTPDGKFTDSKHGPGWAVTQAAIPSHSFENRSEAECRIIIVEHEE
jgi:beta-alanine degradation protein BauB